MADSNPGNFANRPKEEVRAAASKGGKASSSTTDNSGSDNSGTGKQGFASMDPERQHEIASMGGKASSGSFKPGEWRAKEAGHKGGLASHGGGSS
ncbi:hypothetical protein RB595_006927 [Gaeumannomyces hyphopodioides]